MGAPNRVEFYFTKFIGLGIGFDTFPYAVNITIMIPFLTIDVGLGKPYTYIKSEKNKEL